MVIQPPTGAIGKVLSPALQLWLRSQVEAIEDLQIAIAGGNRQILRGHIPRVSFSTRYAVYQGLHFGQAQLAGENIRVNLGQVLKGQPLRLLETVTVTGEVSLDRENLQASLSSPLLATALKDLLSTLVTAKGNPNPEQTLQDWEICWHNATLEHHQLIIKGIVTNADKNTIPLRLSTKLELANSCVLRLYGIEIEAFPLLPVVNLDEFNIDLGQEVELQELALTPAQLLLRGCVQVVP